MAVFYLLPPRPALGECLAKMLQPYVPGALINPNLCADFVDSLVSGSPEADDCYVVYREDLPEGAEVNTALRDGFGAEAGDQIVCVSIGAQAAEPRVKMWRLGAA
jgi:hypothetical protein